MSTEDVTNTSLNFDYTKAVAATSLVIDLYELEQQQKVYNDVLMLVQIANHYQSQYELTRNQYNLTKTLFYIQSTVAIIIADVMLFTAI